MVPKVKRDLELLIYRVKQLASAHGASGKFTVGNLKNRAIDGTHVQEEESESEEEDESDDDDEGDEEVDEEETEDEDGE